MDDNTRGEKRHEQYQGDLDEGQRAGRRRGRGRPLGGGALPGDCREGQGQEDSPPQIVTGVLRRAFAELVEHLLADKLAAVLEAFPEGGFPDTEQPGCLGNLIALDVAQDHGLAGALGKPCDFPPCPLAHLAARGLVDRIGLRGTLCVLRHPLQRLLLARLAPDPREALVAGDTCQPGPEPLRIPELVQAQVAGQEGLLDQVVLGRWIVDVAGAHTAYERQITVHQGGKAGGVPLENVGDYCCVTHVSISLFFVSLPSCRRRGEGCEKEKQGKAPFTAGACMRDRLRTYNSLI